MQLNIYGNNNIKMSTLLVKVLNEEMNHFGFQYQFGVNILKQKLNEDSSEPVGEGGLYFCDINELDSHCYRGVKVCVVELLPDSIVIPLILKNGNHYENRYFRTDKLFLTDKVYRFDNAKDREYLISLNNKLEDYLNDPCFKSR